MRLLIRGLSKRYPNGVQALHDINLSIGTGMFGLLGPNGAGKSSLMRTIVTLQSADRGSIEFDGINVERDPLLIRQKVGYLPQDFGLYPNLTVLATMRYFATMKGIHDKRAQKANIGSLLDLTNLMDHRKKKVKTLSGGMRQRLGIAIALLGKPELVIVDEPTAGLDPAERLRFLNILSEIGEKMVVILSTHIVEDVRTLCQDMAILNQGRVVREGNPNQIIAELEGKVFQIQPPRDEVAAIEQNYRVIARRMVAGMPLYRVYAHINPGDAFEPVQPDLEDAYFMSISGQPAGAARPRTDRRPPLAMRDTMESAPKASLPTAIESAQGQRESRGEVPTVKPATDQTVKADNKPIAPSQNRWARPIAPQPEVKSDQEEKPAAEQSRWARPVDPEVAQRRWAKPVQPKAPEPDQQSGEDASNDTPEAG